MLTFRSHSLGPGADNASRRTGNSVSKCRDARRKGRSSQEAPNRKSAFFWDNHESSEVAPDTVNLLVSSKVIFCRRHSSLFCGKEKGPSDPWSVRNASEGAPAKLQGSYCASVKFKGKDRPQGGWDPARVEGPGHPGASRAPCSPFPGHHHRHRQCHRGPARKRTSTPAARETYRLGGGRNRNRMEEGEKNKEEKPALRGSRLRMERAPVRLGSRPGVRGGGISISPGWLTGELGGGGGRGWERKKKKTNCARH